jgi:demethylmenaquinone methyltransferase/2-methoxy-6-polyprenyl-1,4-benzoquinol methylase
MQVAARVTAVDASPEVLAINAARCPGVTFVEGDVLGDWRPVEQYDAVFFSFWLTHVPPSHAEAFWDLVAGALKPGGRAVFIDNLWRPGGWPPERPSSYVQLRYDLSDGRQFDIVKRYYEPAELVSEMEARGWTASVSATDTYFLMGSASPGTPTPPR